MRGRRRLAGHNSSVSWGEVSGQGGGVVEDGLVVGGAGVGQAVWGGRSWPVAVARWRGSGDGLATRRGCGVVLAEGGCCNAGSVSATTPERLGLGFLIFGRIVSMCVQVGDVSCVTQE